MFSGEVELVKLRITAQAFCAKARHGKEINWDFRRHWAAKEYGEDHADMPQKYVVINVTLITLPID